MPSRKPNSGASGTRAIEGAFLFLFFLSLAPVVAAGQSSAQLRTVRGVVVNASETPVSGAVVYLKNMKTRTVRTYFSSAAGGYHFSGLDPNVNYQVHAEDRDLTSAIHLISSFDSNPDIVINLKVDRKKSSQ